MFGQRRKAGLGLAFMAAACIALPAMLFGSLHAQPPDPGQQGPYAVGQVTITTTNADTGSQLQTEIYYPSSGGGVDPNGAPHPALVFSHGTSFFITTGGANNAGNAEHLASWGFIVALPTFPSDDIEDRGSDIRHVLTFLEEQNADGASAFYHKIDTAHFSLVGHSLGGEASLLVAARDNRIQLGLVPLDPVNPSSNPWDYQAEGPAIDAPVAVIGSPSHTCNWNAKYDTEYPSLGPTHKAKFILQGANHCDFLDAQNPLAATMCGLICGGGFGEDRLMLAERYTAAWLNYYVGLDTDYYSYLYGAQAEADIDAGKVTRELDTAPRDLAATAQPAAVELHWALYGHPIVAGYNIYRSLHPGEYGDRPYAAVGRVASYLDQDVVVGKEYFYLIRSRDAAGNEHEPSSEVSAVPGGGPATAFKVYLPVIVK